MTLIICSPIALERFNIGQICCIAQAYIPMCSQGSLSFAFTKQGRTLQKCEEFFYQAHKDVIEERPWVISPSKQIIGSMPPLTVFKPPVRKEGVVIGAIQSYSSLSLLVKHDEIGRPVAL